MPNQHSELKRNDAEPHFQSLKPVYVIRPSKPTDSSHKLLLESTSPTYSRFGGSSTHALSPSALEPSEL